MNGPRKWWIAAAGAVAIAAVIGAGAVMAQTPVPGTRETGTTLLDRVAQKLGIESSTLSTAIKSSANDDIDAKVASGQLTQAQADAVKQRIANAPAGAPLFGGGFGDHRGMGRGGGVDPAKLATFFGTTADQLRTELQASGATLATVAQAHGRSRDDLKAFLTTDARTHLDQEVAEGKLTQADADGKLATLTGGLDARIDATPPMFGGHGPRFGPGGAPPAAADATPQNG
jgi:hypothetical protein